MNDANESHSIHDSDGDQDPPPSRPGPTVIVFTGGDPMRREVAPLLPDDAFVIAADSGLHTALAMKRSVDVVIGDFDSVTAEALAAATTAGATVERHPVAKDQTDLELALERALERTPARIVVVGGHGGRLDHFLANALLLASPRYAAVAMQAYMGDGLVHVVRDVVDLRGHQADPLTLLPVHGPAHDVVTDGLRFPLRGESLHPGSTRGVSNEFVSTHASVRVGDGVLLAVAPRLPIDNDHEHLWVMERS
jgi:thiamine pyrophosphokinase